MCPDAQSTVKPCSTAVNCFECQLTQKAETTLQEHMHYLNNSTSERAIVPAPLLLLKLNIQYECV